MRRINFAMAFASLLLSIALWLYVEGQQELRVNRVIPLRLVPINLDETRFVIKSLPETAPLNVLGPVDAQERVRDFLRTQRGQGVVATVDFRDARPDVGSYKVRIPRSEDLARLGVELGDMNEATAVVQEVVAKSFTVEAIPSNVPDGFVFSQAEIRPQRVMVRGAQIDVARADKVRVLLDLDGYKPGQKYRTRLEVLDDDGKPLDLVRAEPAEVEVIPALAAAPRERSLFVALTLSQGTSPAPGFRLVGYTVRPLTVMAEGESGPLQRLQSVGTEGISLTGLRARTTRRVRLVAPQGVRLKVDRVEVTLDIEPIPKVETPTTPPVTPPTTGPGTSPSRGTTGSPATKTGNP